MSLEEERDCGRDENFMKTLRSLLAFPIEFSLQVTILGYLAAVQKTLLGIRTSQTPN